MSRTIVLTLVAVLAATAAAQDQPVPPPKPAEPKIERRMANSVERLAVSPDGKWLAASDDLGALVMFSAETAESRVVVPAAPAPKKGEPDPTTFEQLLFTADGSVLVAIPRAADVGTQVIRFISVADGKELRTLDVSFQRDPQTRKISGGDSLSDVGTEPGGAKLRLLRQSTVEIWDTATGEKVESRKNEPYSQRSVLSRDGALTAGGVTSKFWVADTATAKERWKIDVDRIAMSGKKVATMWSGYCHVLGFTTDAKLLLVLSDMEETKDPESLTGDNLDKRTKKTTRIEGHAVADGKAAWHKDVSESVAGWNLVLAADTLALVDDGKLSFLNATTGQLRENAPPTAKYRCAAATPDGLTFWAGTDDGRVLKAKTFPAPKGK